MSLLADGERHRQLLEPVSFDSSIRPTPIESAQVTSEWPNLNEIKPLTSPRRARRIPGDRDQAVSSGTAVGQP